MRLNPDLSPEVMRRRVVRASRFEDVRAYEVAFYLLCIEERRYHTLFGYSCMSQFARAELGLTPRQTRERVRVARALEELPRLKRVFRLGKLAFCAVREITRVATPATEADWIRCALEHSVHDLERLVSGSKDGKVPRKPPFGLPAGKVKLSFEVTPEQMALIETVCAQFTEETGRTANVGEVLLESVQERYEGDESLGKTKKRARRKPRPELTYLMCPQCREGAVSTSAGYVAVTPEVLKDVEPLARVRSAEGGVFKSTNGDRDGIENRATQDEELPVCRPEDPEVPVQQRDVPTPEPMRQLVLARDGHRCTVPDCHESSELQVHHVRWRRHGGRTEVKNLTTLCAAHHGGVHAGTVTVFGQSGIGLGLRFELGRGATHVGRALDPEVVEILAELPAESAERTVATETTHVGRPLVDPLETAPVVCSINSIPEEIDSSWWRCFASRFRWARQRRALEFTPGPGTRRTSRTENPSTTSEQLLPLDPRGWHGLVGHDAAMKVLASAVERVRFAEHPGDLAPGAVLLTGRPGVGKTTLAQAFAAELGVPFHSALGTFLDDPTALLSLLVGLRPGAVLFLDEIHAMPQAVLEVLYTAMEGRYVDLIVTAETETRTIRLKLKPFTLVAATTEEGRLPAALISRFRRRIDLEPFVEGTMSRLLAKVASRRGLPLEPKAHALLVGASLGLPRIGLSLVTEALEATEHMGASSIGLREAQEALAAMDLDARGFDRVQRRILAVLESHAGPMGLDHLATHVGKPAEAIREIYEPDLVRRGWVRRTSRGRQFVRQPPVPGTPGHPKRRCA
jgi:Holliday junction DNA helicase RuvB